MSAQLTIPIPVWLDFIFVWPLLLYRKCKYGFTFRRICLGDGLWTIVDADVYYRLGHLKWSAAGDDDRLYAARILRKTEFGRIKTMYLHREIMNAPSGLLVDHQNGDKLDNRRANLRFATNSENQCNRRKTEKASSQYKGVCLCPEKTHWYANIKHKGKKIWLGSFTSEIAAARAYDTAAIKYHGEFARLNFPEKTLLRSMPP